MNLSYYEHFKGVYHHHHYLINVFIKVRKARICRSIHKCGALQVCKDAALCKTQNLKTIIYTNKLASLEATLF